MRRAPRRHTEEPGQDSFLDIVANLVGILIILVVVIGVRTKQAMVSAAPEPEAPAVDAASAKRQADAVHQDLARLGQQLREQEFEISYRRSERDKVLALVTQGEQELARRREQLDAESRTRFDLDQRFTEATRQLTEFTEIRRALERSAPEVQVLEHRPTPLARTVFGQEIHFRLLRGSLVHVPLDALVEELQEDARRQAWKLKQAPQITEIVGPVDDFRLQYTLVKTTQTVATRVGNAISERVELDHFVLLPVREPLGEPMDRALAPGSHFRDILSRHDPERTTITVWVYPESFEEYRRLQDVLFQWGFLTASRPLPEGRPISGSPYGTRSMAQ